MSCTKCGTENAVGKKFCSQCGSALPSRCSKCGAENTQTSRFCGDCGAALVSNAEPAATRSSQIGSIPPDIRVAPEQPDALAADGERKTVTALFADIKGSTELEQDLDPEEARAIIDPALKLMIDAVRRYNGYIVQSTGDGIFALFGAPLAHEDHPQRALYAALQMQEELKRYSARLRETGSLPLEARVGVNTGEVVVRSIATGGGHTEYTPIGHTTNLASRMQALAPTGSIAISEQTRKFVEGYFQLKSLGPTKVKGVSEPVSVYEVTGLGPLRTRLQQAAGRGFTKFVGRQLEMDAMKAAAEQAKAGHGQIFATVAEAGVGKSRLIFEFKAVSESGWLVLEAFSVSHGKASAFLPVTDLLRSYFEITSEDDERKQRQKITGRVLALDRSLEDTLPYLCALLGLTEEKEPLTQMDAQIRQRRTLDAIKRLLLRESLKQPLMVLFEDLHWIDAETQALLNLLADSIATARVLLLVNYRPEYTHSWGSKTYYTQLRLDALRGETAHEMLGAILGEGKDLLPLKRLIIDRTEGNPFFMEEIVQALFEERALERNGTVKLAKSMSEVKVPATVQAVLSSRIDRLPPAEKDLLQTVAVIGKEFSLRVAAEVAGIPEPERMLAALQTAEFIYEQPAAGDVEYTFKHALTQQVAYEAILHERRRVLHERVGTAIERLDADRIEERYRDLARHFAKSANSAKAIEYLVRAGDSAAAKFALREAWTSWEDALRWFETEGGDPVRHADLLVRAAILRPGREAQAVERLEQALAIYEKLEMCAKTADVHVRLLTIFGNDPALVDLDRAEAHFRKAEALLVELPVNESLASLYEQWAWLYLWKAQGRLGFAAAERSVELAHQLNKASMVARAGIVMGACLWASGRLGEAFDCLERGWQQADAINDAFATTATVNATFDLRNIGDYKEAMRWLEREISRPRNAESPFTETFLYPAQLLGLGSMGELGDIRRIMSEASNPGGYQGVTAAGKLWLTFWDKLEEGEASLTALIGIYRHQQRGENICNFGADAAHLFRLTGHYTKAEELLREGLSYSVPGGNIALELMGRECLAHVLADIGRTDEARSELGRCREIMAAGEDWRGLAGLVEWSEAAIAVAEKRFDDADHHFAGAIEIIRRYSMRNHEGPALCEWGRALHAAGDCDRALEKFDEALELYRRVGAGQPWIDRVLADKRTGGH
jgi:class 3 adenylate cyclase/tetratricopeptide (TPR) repeat protein